jgi:hypothetical protein
MKILKGTELQSFVDEVKSALERVRQYSYGKHIGQIEKVVAEKTEELNALARQQASSGTPVAATPPPLVRDDHSPQSTSQPSTTNNSTVDGPVANSDPSTRKKSVDLETAHQEVPVDEVQG